MKKSKVRESPEYVRISIGTMPQNEAVVKTVAEMLKDRKRR